MAKKQTVQLQSHGAARYGEQADRRYDTMPESGCMASCNLSTRRKGWVATGTKSEEAIGATRLPIASRRATGR